jgi:hypothetical protein
MSGKLAGKGDRIGVEFSGIYKGVLQEDMIDTVRRVKRPAIDVFIEELFFKDQDYPLTYVPMVNMVLPLKKDQEVWVTFPQENNAFFPVLWKLAGDVDDSFVVEKFQVNRFSSGDVQFPDDAVTKEVFKISDDMWVIATDSYCVMHYGDSCVLMNSDGVYTNAEALGLVAKKITVIADEVSMVLKDKADIKNNTASLGGILTELLTALEQFLSAPVVEGSPVNVSAWVSSSVTPIKSKVSALFKS